MLGDDDLCGFLSVRSLSKSHIVRTVNEYHHVGVLLDGTGLSKVAELRLSTAPGPLDRVTGQLRQGYDRDIQLLGRSFQGPGNCGDFLLTHSPQFGRSLHQLKVIDYHETDTLGLDQPLDLGPELHKRDARCVIYVQRSL